MNKRFDLKLSVLTIIMPVDHYAGIGTAQDRICSKDFMEDFYKQGWHSLQSFECIH
jgi:hypothetical protein